MQVSINNSNQLYSLLNKDKRMDFVFEFPGFSAEENKLWFEKIKKNYFACGCNTGKIFMMFSLLAIFVGLLYIYFFQKELFSLMIPVYSFLFLFFMAGIGKAVGKIAAYKKLKKDIEELKIKLAG